jgi:IstB-like ATP binding protein
MVRQLKAADAIGRLAGKLRTYLRPHVLVLDEVGYLPLGRDKANLVFQMISKRYERGAILLTSYRAFSNGEPSSATKSSLPRSWTTLAPLRSHRHQRAQARPKLPAPRISCYQMTNGKYTITSADISSIKLRIIFLLRFPV